MYIAGKEEGGGVKKKTLKQVKETRRWTTGRNITEGELDATNPILKELTLH